MRPKADLHIHQKERARLDRVIFLIPFLFAFALPVSAQGCVEPTDFPAPVIVFDRPEGRTDDVKILDDQIVTYLNFTHSTRGLEDALAPSGTLMFAQVIESDITNDGFEDVLVNVTVNYGATFTTYIGLFTCQDAHFSHLDTFTTGGWSGADQESPAHLLYVVDIGNNQRPEIVLELDTIEGQKYHETLEMLEWNGEKLAVTFTIGPYYGAFSDVRLLNLDENLTTLELIVGYTYAYEEETASAFIEYSHVRPIDMVYTWEGTPPKLTLQCRYFTDEPTSLFDTLHSAEAYYACGHFNEAKTYYGNLYNSERLTAWAEGNWQTPWLIYAESIADKDAYAAELERAYLRAFAGYRFVQIYQSEQDIASLESMVGSLEREYPPGTHGHIYAAMARAYWDAYQLAGQDAACAAAETAFVTDRDDPKIDYYEDKLDDGSVIHYGFYFYSGHRYSSDPDNLFDVPDDIDGMVKIPICL